MAARIVLCLLLLGSVSRVIAQQDDGVGDIPEPMPIVDTSDITHFLLLGSDTTNPANSGRTDVILIVSLNHTHGTVSMLSVPRDLYVYIPEWEQQRINTAYAHGEMIEAGFGPDLLIETIHYNLGLEIDFYARVDFNDFRQIIDSVGGVDIAVDCAIEDWRLREPDLDPTDEDNWEMFTLPVGVHRMDGNLALWYARSRRTSSDFDRGHRQQQLIRALWRELLKLGVYDQAIDIWPQAVELVETDITLEDALTLIPFAVRLDTSQFSTFTFKMDREVKHWRAPDGASVLIPQREALIRLIKDYMAPPVASQAGKTVTSVQIVNATGRTDLAQVAAERLAWEGYNVSVDPDFSGIFKQYTSIVDHTGRVKGSDLEALRAIFHVPAQAIEVLPDPDRIADYEVILGANYYACTRDVLPPAG